MDAELKQKWVAALRSGEYTQERGLVGNQDTKHLCCLGVGAHVSNPGLFLGCTADATEELERHGFPKAVDGHDRFVGAAKSLIDMNDREEKSFLKIADWIEANL